MSDFFKPQRKFIAILLTTIGLMRGKVNFRNSSRYSELSEKTFSRQFRTHFDSAQFDNIGISMVVNPHTFMIAVSDCSFIPKSGGHTYGLAEFYNGTQSEAEKGLEISQLAVADVDYNTAYSIPSWQTPSELAGEDTRTDRYPEHFLQDAPCLPPSVRHLAADGYFAERKITDGVCGAGFHVISKHRHDADLRHLFAGKQKSHGRPGIYDGKVRFDDSSRSEFAGQTDNPSFCTAVVNSPCFRRDIRIVYIVPFVRKQNCHSPFISNGYSSCRGRYFPLLQSAVSDRISVPGCGTVCRTFGLSGSLRDKP